jgi:hypothetical protein
LLTTALTVASTKAEEIRSPDRYRAPHLLLQTRTKTLDGTLRSTFERWYPGLANDNPQPVAPAQAA